MPRPVLLAGPLLGGVTRSLVPATVVLLVGLALGAELPGGVAGPARALRRVRRVLRRRRPVGDRRRRSRFRTQQAGPLMQQGVFLGVFLSTAYTPEVLLRGWLADVAHLNPVTYVLELARQATVTGDRAELGAHVAGAASRWRGWCAVARRARAARAGADGALRTAS